jgi:WD40 repeat protein
MILDQLRAATVLLCLGIGGSYWAWHALASAVDGKGQPNPGPAAVRAPDSSPPPRSDSYGDPLPPGAAMRLGTVRFRQAPGFMHIVYSPDGQFVVTDGGQYRLMVLDARDGKILRQIDLGFEGIGDLVFSPDGKTIAAVGFQLEPKRNVVVNHLVLADAATGRVVHRAGWDDQDNVGRVAYVPDGKTIATVSSDSTLRLWDVAATKLLHRERLVREGKLAPKSIAFSPDAGSRLLAILWQETIDLWDVAHLRRARSIAIDRQYRPNCLMFSLDGTILAAGVASSGEEIRLWRVEDGTLIGRFKSRKNTNVNHMAFSPDGKVLTTVGGKGSPVFFDTATGKELDSFGKEFSFGMGFDLLADSYTADRPLAFSPDGRTLAATGSVQSLHFWDLATGKDRLTTPEAHLGDVIALVCLADGKTIVSGSRDRTVRVWDIATGRSTKMLPHDNWVDSLSVSADGSLLATGPAWGRVNLWNLKTGERLRTWLVDQKSVRGVTLGGDGSSVIAALGDGSLRRWDVSTEKERPIAQPKLEKFPDRGPAGGQANVNRAVFSRDGRSVAFMGGGLVQVVDLISGDRRFKEALGNGFLSTQVCEFAPDGQSLAIVREVRAGFQAGNWSGSSTAASTIVWLDNQTGHVRREIVIPDSDVLALAFSPDGQAIAVGTLLIEPARGFIRIFRLRDKQEIQTIESPCPWINALSFTTDGRRIVAGLSDTSIVIWDVHSTEY